VSELFSKDGCIVLKMNLKARGGLVFKLMYSTIYKKPFLLLQAN